MLHFHFIKKKVLGKLFSWVLFIFINIKFLVL